MLLLIEGNEGTGKTTLINDLMRYAPLPVIKYPKETKNTYGFFKKLLYEKVDAVFDRSFITDLVYRMWDGKSGQMSLYEMTTILESYPDDIRIVFCENKNAWDNAKRRGEDFIKNEETHKLIDENFQRVKTMLQVFTRAKIMTYNYDYNSVSSVVEFMQKRKK